MLILFLFISSTIAYSQGSMKIDTTSLSFEHLEMQIDSIISENNIPGAAITIISPDSVLWMKSFGFANLKTGEPLTINTLFCIGSCTKSFTGLAFLKLLDEGKINLNTPVSEIAPEIKIDNPWRKTDPVRIIHLLEHTSGFEDSHLNWFYFDEPKLSIKEALEEKAHLRKVRWKPGTRFSYSSPGFTLAGYILEKISGQPYQKYMKQNLLDQLGIKTTFIGCPAECQKYKAIGYGKDNKAFPIYYDYDEPAGALHSSIEEMAFYVQFLLSKGAVNQQQIISKSQFDKIGKPVSTLAAQAGLVSGYSFGIGTTYRNGVKWLGHSGAVPGFIAEYYYNPDQQIGFVVLQNSFDTEFSDEVFSAVWDFIGSFVKKNAPLQMFQFTKEQAKNYCGYYEPRNPRMRIMEFGEILSGGLHISWKNDKLFYKYFGGKENPLIAVSQNTFRRKSDHEATFIFIDSGEGKMILASRSFYYEKTSSWKPVIYRFLVFGALIVMMLSVVYAIFWIPVYIFMRLTKRNNYFKYIWIRILPMVTVLSLILGIIPFIVSQPSMLELGMKTIANYIFYCSTLLFAGLSVLSLFIVFNNFKKEMSKFDLICAILFSITNFGITLYLGYWGIIGLKLWVY